VSDAFSDVGGGCRLELHVVPRASRTQLAGLHDGRIKLQVAAPPVDGEANAAIVRFMAKALGVGRDAVDIVAGANGRKKTLEVRGVSAVEAAARLL
jgi:uncharacterized protein (TIGR00251 family)